MSIRQRGPLVSFDIQAEGSSVTTWVLDAASGATLIVPGGDLLLTATFIRHGSDLILKGDDGTTVVIRDFFAQAEPPVLMTEGGAVIPPDLAARLAGSVAPGQYAQAAPAAGAEPAGTVEEIEGEVFATRTDGTLAELDAGDPIFQGDVLETGPDASVGIVFVDGTTFALEENARIIVDEMVFDPASGQGSAALSMVQGAFVFVTGQIAATNPDGMTVRTPVAVIAIRGTTVAGRAAQEGEENTITLLADPDGTVGVITVTNIAGTSTITLTTLNQSTSLSSSFGTIQTFTLSPQEVEESYGNLIESTNSKFISKPRHYC